MARNLVATKASRPAVITPEQPSIWRHANRRWATKYLSLWINNSEEMIRGRYDAGYLAPVDHPRMKCFTEYEKQRMRTGASFYSYFDSLYFPSENLG
jgi:hypothetical protein